MGPGAATRAYNVYSINYYSPQIFKAIGLQSNSAGLFATGIYGVVKVVITALGLMLATEQIGRKVSWASITFTYRMTGGRRILTVCPLARHEITSVPGHRGSSSLLKASHCQIGPPRPEWVNTLAADAPCSANTAQTTPS